MWDKAGGLGVPFRNRCSHLLLHLVSVSQFKIGLSIPVDKQMEPNVMVHAKIVLLSWNMEHPLELLPVEQGLLLYDWEQEFIIQGCTT